CEAGGAAVPAGSATARDARLARRVAHVAARRVAALRVRLASAALSVGRTQRRAAVALRDARLARRKTALVVAAEALPGAALRAGGMADAVRSRRALAARAVREAERARRRRARLRRARHAVVAVARDARARRRLARRRRAGACGRVRRRACRARSVREACTRR